MSVRTPSTRCLKFVISLEREVKLEGGMGMLRKEGTRKGLVCRNADRLSGTAVGGNNVTNLEGDHITGDKVGGF
jgi:hypothetical protein